MARRREGRGSHFRGGRPAPRGPQGGRGGGPGEPRRSGSLSLRTLPDGRFTLVHPPCVHERREDYEDGLAIWQAGEVEEAREALRFALEGCGDNLWVHVALGRLALEADRDLALARGHFGYAFELVRAAVPEGFPGPLPRELPLNAPFYDAAEGLAAVLESAGQGPEAAEVRRLVAAWSSGPAPR